jgi:DNA-binding transcriptional ArsR family regulator
MTNGEKLTIAMTAPNALMADRRLKMRVSRASGVEMFECFTIFLHPFGTALLVTQLRSGGSMISFRARSKCLVNFDRDRSVRVERCARICIVARPIWSSAMPTIAPQIAEVAQLVGDPGRANILSILMDGRALTASELAGVAGVTAQTTSSYLAKLVERELLTVEKRGPRRFYRLATPLVAWMLEGIMNVAVTGPPRFRPPSRCDSEMRRARTCYDHLAGELGVALTDAMIERGYVVLDADAGELTEAGSGFLAGLGADLTPAARSRRARRPCLDWSERRPHLAGRVGAAIAHLGFERDWIRRRRVGRSVEITVDGIVAFKETFGARI